MFRVLNLTELTKLQLRFPLLVKSAYKAGVGFEQEVTDKGALYDAATTILPRQILIFQAPRTLGGLLEALHDDTACHSSMRVRIEHPNFFKIVAFGDVALRYILVKLAADEIHWEYFGLLRELTDANPVKLEHRGFLDAMVDDWLQWAETNGKLDPIGLLLRHANTALIT